MDNWNGPCDSLALLCPFKHLEAIANDWNAYLARDLSKDPPGWVSAPMSRSDLEEEMESTVEAILAVANWGRTEGRPGTRSGAQSEDNLGRLWRVCPGGAFLCVGLPSSMPTAISFSSDCFPDDFCADLCKPKHLRPTALGTRWRKAEDDPNHPETVDVYRLPAGAVVMQVHARAGSA